MKIILAEFRIKPERLDEFIELARYMVEHAVNDEPGCLRLDLLRDSEDSDRFFLYEVYRDEAAFQSHRQKPYVTESADKLSEMFASPVRLENAYNFIPSDADWR